MLKMKEIDKLRSLYYEDNLSISRISQTMKISRTTVYRYVHCEDFNPKKRKPSKYKISEYADVIDSWLQLDAKAPTKQRHSAKKIL